MKQTLNFIETYKVDKNICDDLIKYFKKNKEYFSSGATSDGKVDTQNKDSTDVYFFNQSKDKSIKNFFSSLQDPINDYVNKYNIVDNVKTYVGNNIQYYKPKGGYHSLHYERNVLYPNRILAYMLYLNTVTDKGGTEFPNQNITLSAIKGNLHIWPAEFTHPHRGVISQTQEKYIATGWFEILK